MYHKVLDVTSKRRFSEKMVDLWRQSTELQESKENVYRKEDPEEGFDQRIFISEKNRQNIWAVQSIYDDADYGHDANTGVESFDVQGSRDYVFDEREESTVWGRRRFEGYEESENGERFSKESFGEVGEFLNIHDVRKSFEYYGSVDDEEDKEWDKEVARSLRGENILEEAKSETETDQSYGLLGDIPKEILRDRQALISKLREEKILQSDLQRKNRFLQNRVARVMTKKHQTMTPEHETLSSRDTEDHYIKRLISCKTTIDEIEARQREITTELENLEADHQKINDEDSQTFGELLDRERQIGVDLVFQKSARKLTVKSVEAIIRRQVLRRALLNRDRFNYIFQRHRHEKLKTKLRLMETLGDGMTIMDYQAMVMDNDSYKEKIDDRDYILHKLDAKLREDQNKLIHYKEKEIKVQSDIHRDESILEKYKCDARETRFNLNYLHQTLRHIRGLCMDKKYQAALLFALPVLREMEKSLQTLNVLKTKVENLSTQIELFSSHHKQRGSFHGKISSSKMQVDDTCTSVTRMTKVKRSGPKER